MNRWWRAVLVGLAVVGFDMAIAVLGVGFVTSQHNARDAIKAQRASAAAATRRINEYRLQQARDHATIEQLVAAQDEDDRQRIAAAAAQASIDAAAKRAASDRRTSKTTTKPTSSSTTSTSTTTTTTTPPGSCLLVVCVR